MTKVGVLLPQSQTYKSIGRDFVRGFQLSDDQEFEIVIEGIGIGNDAELTSNLIDKLVLQKQVDIIIGLVGDFDLSVLYEKVNGLEVPAVFARFGAFPNIKTKGNKYAFTLSYGLSEGLYQAGQWCVEQGWNKVATSGSFNDIGYGFVRSLEMGLYNAGGQFVGHRSTPLKPKGDEAEIAQKFYDELECDVICELYNGEYAEENITYMNALNGQVEKPLIYTPFGATAEQLQQLGDKVSTLLMLGPWLSAEYTGEETPFDKTYFDKHDRLPSISDWLGYQTYLVVQDLLKHRKELLAGEEFSLTDNNEVRCDSDLIVHFPMKIWKAEKKNDKWLMKPTTTFGSDNIIPEPFEGQVNGWHNAYLCY